MCTNHFVSSGLIEYDNGTQLHVQSLPNATTLVVVASSADERVVNDDGQILKLWESMFHGDVDFLQLPEIEASSSNEPGPCPRGSKCNTARARWSRGVLPTGGQVEHFQIVNKTHGFQGLEYFELRCVIAFIWAAPAEFGHIFVWFTFDEK